MHRAGLSAAGPPSHPEDDHLSDQFKTTLSQPVSRASCLLLCATLDTTATTHSVLPASSSRLPSSPSLLSPPLRWWTIDLRNEVGLLSRIYTGFSLCVSDRFPPMRHSLSLRIFMLVRTRQRTQEQGEDAPETALPLASSPSPLGRGFLGLMLVGLCGFFPPFYSQLPSPPAPSPPPCSRTPARDGLFLSGRSRMVPPGQSHLWGQGVCGDIPHCGYTRCHLFSSSWQAGACGRRCRTDADGL